MIIQSTQMLILSLPLFSVNIECQLPKSFKVDDLVVSHTENWNYFEYQKVHTLTYYNDGDWERREDAEISFISTPIADARVLDSMDIASTFSAYLRDMVKKNEKFTESDMTYSITKEQVESFAERKWRKITMNASGTDKLHGRQELICDFYLTYSSTSLIVIVISRLLPKISTVEIEIPCILSSLKFE